ncbi:MAG: replication-associated recombination protein A [Planctomycetes bacterium]|nr:replication-associated recombination protein A [Planctomycetota bacterium]
MTKQLFDKNTSGEFAPLADRMRPRNFDEFVGQDHIVAPDKPLRKAVKAKSLPSIILWGPPGSGKTTLARLIAQESNLAFMSFSAVTSGIKEIKEVIQIAHTERQLNNKGTVLFVDEIHRFNKAQQDAFLPHVENGTITLIGATTENPSFEVISALISRSRVYVLKQLTADDLRKIIANALSDKERGLGRCKLEFEDGVDDYIINIANGDARAALNLLELAASSADSAAEGGLSVKITRKNVEECAQKKTLLYDKTAEEHYNLISALHKSIRGSDPQASLYWLARMLEAGEDPVYIARRLIRAASEDVGMADPQALVVCMAAKDAVELIGMPEGNLALAQAAVYLATAPKSNALYVAYKNVVKDINAEDAQPVPLHLRNPVTDLMKKLDYGDGYKYPHDFKYAFAQQQYLPDNLQGREYYKPTDYGFEKEVKKRMEFWKKLMS